MATIIIDDFEVSPASAAVSAGNPNVQISQSGLDTAHVRGGTRLIELFDRPANNAVAPASIDISSGAFTYVKNPWSRVLLTYSFTATNITSVSLVFTAAPHSLNVSARASFSQTNFWSGTTFEHISGIRSGINLGAISSPGTLTLTKHEEGMESTHVHTWSATTKLYIELYRERETSGGSNGTFTIAGITAETP